MDINDPIKDNLENFKEAYLNDFGIELSDKEAYEALFNLVGFFNALMKIDRKIKLEKKFKYSKIKL